MKKSGAARQLMPYYRIINGKYYNIVGYSSGEILIEVAEYEFIFSH